MAEIFEVPIGKDLLIIKTGKWRVYRYTIDTKICNKCGLCVIYCPTRSIKNNEAKNILEIDLDYCKGCGICFVECPRKAIKRTREVD